MKSVFPSILLVISSQVSALVAFPPEFADFFLAREENIELIIAGEARGKTVKATVSYNSFLLANTDENIAILQSFLTSKNLTDQSINDIEKAMLAGLSNLPNCEARVEVCIPEDIPGQAEYAFNIDAKQLKIFVSSDLLTSQSVEHEYYSAFRAQSALINNSNLYTYYSRENDAQLTWSNDAVIGLPYGHISLDTQYRTDTNEFDLYEALYDFEISNVRTLFGYQAFNRQNVNSTDFLSYGSDFSGTALTIGSSQNLLKGGQQTQQRIYFFAPEAGQLEVYQNERLLINRSINSGQQFLTYNELPSGIYNITIVIRRGEDELLREQRQIVNSSSFTLPLHSWDYRLESGFLDENNLDVEDDKRFYLRGALAFRATESLLLASGLMSNTDSLGVQFGAYWSPHQRFDLQYSASIFDSGANFHSAQLRFSPFSLTFRKVSNDQTDSFSSLIYSDDNYLEWGGSVSGSLFGGSGYISYFSYQYDDELSTNRDYQSLSTSWTRQLMGGLFSLNFAHNRYQNGSNDWSTNFSWSHRFNDKVSGRVSGYTDNEGDYSLQASSTYSAQHESWQGSATASARVSDGLNADLSANISGTQEYFKYSASGFVDDTVDVSLSGSISSSQVISKAGFNVANSASDAFVTVNSTMQANPDRNVALNYQLIRGNRSWQSGTMDVNQAKTFGVSTYNEIGVELDAASYSAEVNYDDSKHFVMPGMHYHFDANVVPLESQIVIIGDINGDTVGLVQCQGEGCRSVEQISDDGVYRINYVNGKPFTLAAKGMSCLYDEKALGQDFINSSCLTDVQIAQRNSETLNNFANALNQASTADTASNKIISKEQLEKIMVRVKELQESIRLSFREKTDKNTE